MSRLTESQKKEIHYNIYEQLLQDERVSFTNMAKNLSLARNTVTSHFNYMLENEILLPPSLRLKMFDDLREYAYCLNFEKPVRVFQELENDPRVVYHSMTSGAFDMIVITNTPIDFEAHPCFKECVLEGPRSDLYASHVSRDMYEEAFLKIKKTAEEGSLKKGLLPSEYPPRKIIWTDLEWELFYDLKYNVRRTFTEIVKKHGISKELFYQSYEHVKKNCVTLISYFPEGRLNYYDFYFLLKSDYEEALKDLFMQLPCTNMVYHIKDRMAAWINILRTFPVREFFGLLYWMNEHGIIDDIMYSLAFYTPSSKFGRQ